MSNWRELRVEGIGSIEPIVAVFQIFGGAILPFANFKIKVIERSDGTYLASANVAVLGSDGHPDWEAGLGSTIEEALEDALRRFVRLIGERKPTSESEFAWSDPTEF